MTCKDCQTARGVRRPGRPAPARRRCGVWISFVMWLGPCPAALIGASAQGAETPTTAPVARGAPVSLRVWPVAVVMSDRITVDDIGRVLHGPPAMAASLRSVVVGPAPAAGTTAVVTLKDIEEAIERAGIRRPDVLVSGASRCQVSRPGTSGTGLDATSRPAGAATSRPASEGGLSSGDARATGAAPASRPAPSPAKDSLEEAVVRHLTAKLAGLEGKPEIRFSAAAARVLALSGPLYQFRIRDRGEECLGVVALEADIIENGRVADTVPIVADVAVLKPVAVARLPINRGEVIKPEHLMLAERRFTRLGNTGVSDLASLVGQEATRFIDRGAMVSVRDVRPRALVGRGDIVTVWVRQGDLVVKSAAKALHAGTYGEVIDVKDEASGQTYSVKITGPRTAELASPGPGAGGDDTGRQG